jgi:hypothetical protein
MKTIGIIAASLLCLFLYSNVSFAQSSSRNNRGNEQISRFDDSASSMGWIDILGSGLDSIHHKAMVFHDSLVKSKFEVIKRTVDSVKSQMKRLKDSLNYEGGGNLGELLNKFDLKGLIGDSLLKNLPFDIEGKTNSPFFPKNFIQPKQKEHKPIPGFKNWHYEELAEL